MSLPPILKKAFAPFIEKAQSAEPVAAPPPNAPSDAYKPEDLPSPPPLSDPEATQLDAMGLSQEEQDAFRRAAEGEQGNAMAHDVRLTLRGVAGAASGEQAGLTRAALSSPLSATATAGLVNSAAWLTGTPEERTQLAAVMGEASGAGRADLTALALYTDKLKSVDTEGNTLLSNLAGLSTTALAPEVEDLTRTQLLDSVLREVTHTDQVVRQGDYQTCVAASAQYELVRDAPAEYARLIHGLSSGDGTVRMAGQDELTLQPELFDKDLGEDVRTPAAALFQSAVMDYANGDADYDARLSATVRRSHGKGGRVGLPGLIVESNEKVHVGEVPAQLFNTTYTPYKGNWGDFAKLLKGIDTTGDTPPVIVSLKLGDDLENGHTMAFHHFDGERIYLHNSWNPLPEQEGQDNQGLTLEDADTSLYSLPLSEFRRRYSNTLIPAELMSGG